jgi:hypothetical protein
MKYLERLLLIVAACLLAGTNKCREDYFFARQARVSITGTPDSTTTVTRTPTGTISATATSTPTGTISAIPTEDTDLDPDPDLDQTSTPTPSASPTATAVSSATQLRALNSRSNSASDTSLLSELAQLDDPSFTPSPTPKSAQNAAVQASSGLDGTWLGNLYKEEGLDSEQEASWSIDQDGDGYVDALEDALGSDKIDPRSQPGGLPKTNLQTRVSRVDLDMDGLSDQQEIDQGTDKLNKDSDGDGVMDGAESLSGSNPMNAKSIAPDSDVDGLSDDYEIAEGLNSNNPDTDGDGLSDFMELVLGSNPLVKDTDLDGILDGREVKLGGDPLVSDFPRK